MLNVFENLEEVGGWGEIKVYDIPIDRFVVNAWNPNEQSEETFNQLVEEIGEEGFDQPLQVCPVLDVDGSFDTQNGKFKIIGGEHRYKAMQYLDKTKIPAVIKDTWNEEEQKIKTVRRNLLTGTMNAKKFTELVDSLQTQYDLDKDYLTNAMGFKSDEEFERYYKQDKVKKTEEEQAIVDSMNNEIAFVDDISSIVSELMREYGDTMPAGVVGFYFKKRPVFLSSCNSKLATLMCKFIQNAKDNPEKDIREELIKVLEPVVKSVKLDKERPFYKSLMKNETPENIENK